MLGRYTTKANPMTFHYLSTIIHKKNSEIEQSAAIVKPKNRGLLIKLSFKSEKNIYIID